MTSPPPPFPREVVDRVRARLLEGAATGFPGLVPSVQEAREALLAEVEGLSDGQARFKPATSGGEAGWSVLEVMRHVLVDEVDLGGQVLALAAGEPTPGSVIGRLGGMESASLGEVVDALRAARARLIDAVQAMAGSERLDVTAPHPWFGDLNCRAWFLFQRIHDSDHTRQVQAIKDHPDFPKR